MKIGESKKMCFIEPLTTVLKFFCRKAISFNPPTGVKFLSLSLFLLLVKSTFLECLIVIWRDFLALAWLTRFIREGQEKVRSIYGPFHSDNHRELRVMKTVEAEVCDALLLPYLSQTKPIACLALAVANGQEEQGFDQNLHSGIRQTQSKPSV